MNENSQAFNRFLQLAEDYGLCRLSFKAAERAAKEVCTAAKARLDSERAKTAARIQELEDLQQDFSRTETSRRMTALELEQLRSKQFAVLAGEETAFREAVEDMQTAAGDLHRLQGEIRVAAGEVGKEVKRLREETLGDPYTCLYEKWVDGIQREFLSLAQEVGA